MLVCETETFGHFSRLQELFFDSLDRLISEGRGDLTYKENFFSFMSPKCASHNSLVIQQQGTMFVEHVARLVGLLIALKEVPAGDEHRDLRAGCLYDVFVYFEQLRRERAALSYLYRLVDLHEAGSSFIEAALTLELHTAKLSWTDDLLPELRDTKLRYPQQSQRVRKMQIYRQIIDFFARGKAWEYAIQFTKELAIQVGLYQCVHNSTQDMPAKTYTRALHGTCLYPFFNTAYLLIYICRIVSLPLCSLKPRRSITQR